MTQPSSSPPGAGRNRVHFVHVRPRARAGGARADAAAAEEADDGAFDLFGDADARLRLSLPRAVADDRAPAAQASVDATYHGFYAGAWVSNIARFADTNAELDLYAGYGGIGRADRI